MHMYIRIQSLDGESKEEEEMYIIFAEKHSPISIDKEQNKRQLVTHNIHLSFKVNYIIYKGVIVVLTRREQEHLSPVMYM